MMSTSERLYDFAGEQHHETDAALLIFDGQNEYWFPKLHIQDNRDGTYTIPEWLAIKKGLV